MLPVALQITIATVVLSRAGEPPELIDFDRDVRPILADSCFACHGPHADKRRARLRLDLRVVTQFES